MLPAPANSKDQLIAPIELSNMSPEETVRAPLLGHPEVLPDIRPMDHSFGSISARTLESNSSISNTLEPESSGHPPSQLFEDNDRESLLSASVPLAENGLSRTGTFVTENFSSMANQNNSSDIQGWFEEECRHVLVKYCQHIPRNHHYTDGIQKIYQILREHLGDENMDLSIGVLHELIEVDTMFTWESGAVFKRWQFDHSYRKVGPPSTCAANEFSDLDILDESDQRTLSSS